MNLILLTEDDFVDESHVRLAGRRHKHARDTLKARAGDSLSVGIVGGKIGTGRIVHMDDKSLEMEVACTQDPPPASACTLILALPRPPVLRRILQGVTALGVKKIVLLQTRRVEKSYWNSPALTPPDIRAQLLLGLEQAKDTVVPQVFIRKRFKPFVEDELPSLCEAKLKLVAHPGPVTNCPGRQAGVPVVLAVGPEGGFVPFEVEKWREAGFRTVSLGPRVLRVETAVPFLLGRLSETNVKNFGAVV